MNTRFLRSFPFRRAGITAILVGIEAAIILYIPPTREYIVVGNVFLQSLIVFLICSFFLSAKDTLLGTFFVLCFLLMTYLLGFHLLNTILLTLVIITLHFAIHPEPQSKK